MLKKTFFPVVPHSGCEGPWKKSENRVEKPLGGCWPARFTSGSAVPSSIWGKSPGIWCLVQFCLGWAAGSFGRSWPLFWLGEPAPKSSFPFGIDRLSFAMLIFFGIPVLAIFWLAASLPMITEGGIRIHRRRKFIPVTKPKVFSPPPNCATHTFPFCRANHLTSLPVCPHLQNEEGRTDPVLIIKSNGFKAFWSH